MLKNTPSKPSSVVKRKRKKLIRTGLVPDSSPGSTPTLSARDQLNSIIQFASSKFKMTKEQRRDARGRAATVGIKTGIFGAGVGGVLANTTDPESHKRFMRDLDGMFSPPEGLNEHGDLVIHPRKAQPFETGAFTEEERLARATKLEERLSRLKSAKRIGAGAAIGAAILGGMAAHSSYESSKAKAKGAKLRADKAKALKTTTMSAREQLGVIKFKALDLGYTYGDLGCSPSESEKKKHYPSLNIYDRDTDLDLPLSGKAMVNYKLRSKTTRQNEEGKKKHSADIEIQSIDPIEEEPSEKVKEGQPAKLLMSARHRLDEIRFGVGRDFASAAAVGAGTVAGVGGAFATHNAIMGRGGYNAVRKEGIAGLKSLIKKARKKIHLSARDQLNSIINFVADPRSRNLLGEFNGGEAEGPQPGAMRITYGNQARSVGETLGSGAIAGVGGVAAGSAVKALLAKAKNMLRK